MSVSCCAFSLLRTQHLRIAINYGAVIQFSERLTEPKVNYVHWETNTPGIFEARGGGRTVLDGYRGPFDLAWARITSLPALEKSQDKALKKDGT